MTTFALFKCLAALLIVMGLIFRRSKLLRVAAIGASVLLIWTAIQMGSLVLLVLNVGLIAINLRGLNRIATRRKPTRPVSEMDHEVHEKIRGIAAESRYSSAGIEF